MNRRMARGAGLIFLRQVVESGCRSRACVHCERMTLQAEQVHLGAFQKPRIGRAMRSMADGAALYLDRLMFIYERSGFVRVTLEANQILRHRGSQLPRQKSAMRVVAVRAFHDAFVYAVMKGPVELLLLVEMAGVAERRLTLFQEKLAFFCVMGIMAINAADSVLEVNRARVIAVFLPVLVAIQAARTDFRSRGSFKRKNLGFVSATVHVGFTRAMTRLAPMPFGALFRIQSSHEMRRILEALVKALGRHVLVAGFACFRPNVLGRIRGPRIFLLVGWFGFARRRPRIDAGSHN